MQERIDWKTAPPLWTTALGGTLDLDRPEVLRFASDDFIERFQAELADEDGDVGGYVAQPETWRAPAAGVANPGSGTLKLYQPTHGRFYLVAASLVCARYGLPDRKLGPGESVFYVVRRLEPTGSGAVDPEVPATFTEFAWVVDGAGERWEAASGGLAADEERLPMFPMSYQVNGSKRRRLLAGLVPVAAREKYENAVVSATVPPASTDPIADVADARLDKLEAAIVGFQSLLDLDGTDVAASTDADTRNMLRESFFFAILDLATFVHDELPAVWGGAPLPTTLGTDRLAAAFTAAKSWRTALHEAYAQTATVLLDMPDPPPQPVTGLAYSTMKTAIGTVGVAAGEEVTETDLFDECHDVLPSEPAAVADAEDEEEQTEASFTDGAVYVARCVYHRPHCRPAEQVQMSAATRAFTLSHFFDPDAPYRETPIVLPVDTSLEGLRKFPNAAKVAISAQLRKQMDRVQGIKLGDLDDGKVPDEDDGFSLGMICSLSIPIITICALILLMIIVSLLNIVFFWLPLFRICKPKVG